MKIEMPKYRRFGRYRLWVTRTKFAGDSWDFDSIADAKFFIEKWRLEGNGPLVPRRGLQIYDLVEKKVVEPYW